MPITNGLARRFRADLVNGVHRASDRYRAALYSPAASIGPDTEGYTPDGEVEGEGYDAGGIVLTGRIVGEIEGGGAYLDFDDPVWERATIRARGALIYNDSRAGDPALGVIDFGRVAASTAGRFTIELPDPEIDPLFVLE